jgi:hypothetical protein
MTLTLDAILREDYRNFPRQQHYDCYAEDVYFQDPLTRFQGLDRYRQMIAFIERWFQDPELTLHDLQQHGDQIETRWTLCWTTPLPWKPRIAISGRTEMHLNAQGLIDRHIDHWDCSPWSVVRQHVAPARPDQIDRMGS